MIIDQDYSNAASPISDPAATPIDEMLQPAPRPRRRVRSVAIDRQEIANRVCDFYTDDLQGRQTDRDRRIQRYAKFRMWSEGKSWPWVGSSDIGLPDMMEKSLRVQDTLHNAVMSSRPTVMNAKAAGESDKGKQDTIDKLIDYQVFVEAKGENRIGDLIESFVNDGVFTAFTPWVKEKRDVIQVMEYPMPDATVDFFDYLQSIVAQLYPNAHDAYPEGDGWDWCCYPTQDEKVRISFYTEDDDTGAEHDEKIIAHVKKFVTVHDGPVIIPMDYDDVIYMPGAGNLQAPGPANPGGASHVILRSSPTIDEIKTLASQGYYDLVTPEDLERLRPVMAPAGDELKKQALDRTQGQSQQGEPKDKSQGTVTRLVCFDRFDIDGDGLAEDVVFWVLLEPKIVLRARHLSEVFPAKVPRRPLSEATFVPAGGRREGISLLEIQEGIHDVMKMLFDITSDSGMLGALPVFFYRMAGGMKPEALALFPGMGIPVGDPNRDVNFPNVSNPNALAMLLNLINIVGQWGDRTTMIGDFQLGRVPAGRSSALRTTGSVSMLAAQGDARPERVLRRFFTGMAEMWSNIHDLNCAFLPRKKQIRISGLKRPDEDPFVTIEGREQIDGIMEFEFEANAFNTSKAAMQQALMQIAGMALTPLGVQSGIIGPEQIYNLFRDIGKAFGVNTTGYFKAPNAEANQPLITAQDAITAVMADQVPYGRPSEPGGAMEHLQLIVQFMQSGDPAVGTLTEKQSVALGQYAKSLVERIMAERQQQALMEAAAQYSQGGQGGAPDPGGAPTQSVSDPNAPNAPISGGGELTDETLPTAGGGGQPEQVAA